VAGCVVGSPTPSKLGVLVGVGVVKPGVARPLVVGVPRVPAAVVGGVVADV